MREAMLAIAQKFADTIPLGDGNLLAGIKKIITGGFENLPIADSDMPAIQIIYRGSIPEKRGVPCVEMRASFEIRLVYNANKFRQNTDAGSTKVQYIDTSLNLQDQVEKRTNCEYDPTSICGVIMANKHLKYLPGDGSEVVQGWNWTIDNIQYGTFQRGSGKTYPTGEAIISTSLFYSI